MTRFERLLRRVVVTSPPKWATWAVGASAVLVVTVAAATIALRSLDFGWPNGPTKHATAEIAMLRSDPGLDSAPAGATLSDRGQSDQCSDWFDQRPPTVWRDYHYAGSVTDWFDYFNRTLPARGWTRTADFDSAGNRVLNFTRRYPTFDAELIVSQGEVLGEISSPSFC